MSHHLLVICTFSPVRLDRLSLSEKVIYTFCRASGVFLWLFGNMDSHRDRKEFRRRIETSFSGCVSTDVRLFRRLLIESVQ